MKDAPEGAPLPEVDVESIGAGGVGVGNLPDGRIVFLPRTAPGDRVRVRVTRQKKRWARGEAVEWEARGPRRREPPCPRYAECGGCSLQHLEYPAQLRWKSRMVGDALRRIGGLEVTDPPVVPSSRELRYRNKMTFTLRRLGGGRVVAGLKGWRDPARVVDIGGECLLPTEELVHLWVKLRSNWEPRASLLPEGRELRLTLREGTGGHALILRGGRGDGDPYALQRAVPELVSIWREEEDGSFRHLAGETALATHWLRERRELPGGAFLQVNAEAGEELHRYVLEEARLTPGSTVCDAYCGIGVLGRELAARGAEVVGLEADPQGAGAAERGAPHGFSVRTGRVEEILSDVLGPDGVTDILLLNPPRAGLDPSIPELLGTGPVRRVIYVSCDPATLARDLERMGSRYRVQGVCSFDLFPQTDHVETVVTLALQDG